MNRRELLLGSVATVAALYVPAQAEAEPTCELYEYAYHIDFGPIVRPKSIRVFANGRELTG